MYPDIEESRRGAIVSVAQARTICREAGVIWKDTVGRGPTDANAFAGEAGLTMMFRGTLTLVERETVGRGNAQQVADIRRALFEANRDRLVACVERESGRSVLEAFYDVSPEHDMSIFTFVFDRAGDAPPEPSSPQPATASEQPR